MIDMPQPVWEHTEAVTGLLIRMEYRLVITPSSDDALATYWCEGFLKVGGCDELCEPTWQFRARTLHEGIAMLLDQVEIERDVTESITGSRK